MKNICLKCDFLLPGFMLLDVNNSTYNNTRTFDAMRSCKESIHAEQSKGFASISLYNKM